jgi:hypothetical protein
MFSTTVSSTCCDRTQPHTDPSNVTNKLCLSVYRYCSTPEQGKTPPGHRHAPSRQIKNSAISLIMAECNVTAYSGWIESSNACVRFFLSLGPSYAPTTRPQMPCFYVLTKCKLNSVHFASRYRPLRILQRPVTVNNVFAQYSFYLPQIDRL